jgi:hypothetical protein
MTRFIDVAIKAEVEQRITPEGQLFIPLAALRVYRERLDKHWVKAIAKAIGANHSRLDFP